mgnify:FL=1
MSSTKTIGIIGGGQLGQMMLSQLFTWATRLSPLILQQIVHLLVCLRLSWHPTMM